MKNCKKVFAIFMTMFMVVSMFAGININSFAASVDYLTYEITNGEVTITDCDESASGEVIIPETIEGYPVTAIGPYAFSLCDGLTSITIPDSVTSIGEGAFVGCDGLTSIIVDKKNQHYSSDSFGVLFDKNKTTLIQYPAGSSATEYIIPESVTTIGDYAFYCCYNLTSITIPDGVTSIRDYAFWFCTSLISITIPDGVTSIEDYVFYCCYNLTSITLPDGITSIGYSALSVCYNLTNITIPDGVTSIGDYAFSFCYNLTNITIPDGVTSIEESVFSFCTNLTSITIPENVTSIGEKAFYCCNSLTNIIIPESVTTIGSYAIGFDASVSDFERIDGVVIYGKTGSAAEVYALENGVEFVSTGTVCEHTETEVIPGKAATCTDAGLADGEKCSACGEETKAQTEIPATGHTAGEWEVVTPAKVGVDGLEIQKCSVCDEKLEEKIIPALEEPATPENPGDVNGDGKITAADARIVLRASAKLENLDEIYILAADVNKDNKVNAADARIILRVSAKLETL